MSNKNKINKKIIINIETKGNSNSQKYTNDLDFSISDIDGEFKVNTSNIIDFGAETNIEELNDENCLFIDEISDEELLQTSDAIKDKLLLVLREKNQNLNIIDTANSNTVILSNEDNNNESEKDENKTEIKKILIRKISSIMGEYISQDKNLKLSDLSNLQIEGHEVTVSVTDSLAIITVDGYNFKLDSEFNLSD